MKRLVLSIMIILAALSTFHTPLNAAVELHLAQTAKELWGTIVVKVAKEAFPDYAVVDYEYEGSEDKGNNLAVARFDLHLKRNTEERTIEVQVEYNKQTNKLIALRIEEDTD